MVGRRRSEPPAAAATGAGSAAAEAARAEAALKELQTIAVAGGNVFESMLEACKVCSLGSITSALFEVGGAYRRNM